MNARALSIRSPFAGILLLSLIPLGCNRPAPPAAPPPPKVTVALPATRTVINNRYFTGRTEAIMSAEIRARVSGYLVGMHFDPAEHVKEGDVLFTIEKELYEATRAQRAAILASAEANENRARADQERVEKALETNAVSRQEVALRQADHDIAVASVLEAEANLAKAELDLSYCDVTSPIAGQVSRNLVDVGNLVGSGQNTLLATVAKMDPIFVYFEASEKIVLRHLSKGVRDERQDPIPAFLALGDDEGYRYEGEIDYVDNRVDPDTGTITVRGTFPNSGQRIYPGLFARVRVPGQPIEGAILVEEKALGTDLAGKYVLTVDEENMVALQHVELGELQGTMRVILSGLEAEQRYIVNGMIRARPGRPCTPTMQSETAPGN